MRVYPLLPVLALALAASGLKAAAPAAPVAPPPPAPKLAAGPTQTVPPASTAALSERSAAAFAAAKRGPALTVTLKDFQKAVVYLKSYDRYFLSVFNAKGTLFNLPWPEVASVEGPPSGADLAALRAHITPAPAAVGGLIQPRDPGTALRLALWPGVLLHGCGFLYDGAHSSFAELSGAEGFGVVLALFGAYLNKFPNTQDTNATLPQDLTIAGAAIFAVTWAWDLGFSPQYALRVNRQQGLALAPMSAPGVQGVQLSCRF